ncbi:Protein CBG27715 [Caenorhabditis briggsae]|uniref:Protein CBG27715 n=1 Tax=Caenorhabditis briggsae TaxID=6238 RepID=B6IJ13_CAEBR|nr:Protein CBG27715 [Caenorhabditis briggsae]CAR99993.1 Protein CBG27715 [Caenorhabditis briggsae]
MDTNGYTTFKVDCSSLSPSAQTDIFRLIVRCIDDQRRLESAAQVITDNVESIRIVEKAMLYVSSSTDEICLIAGK